MDTFGRLPTEVIEHIKFFYEDPVLEIKIIEDFGWHNLDNIYHINLIITINTNIIYTIQLLTSFSHFNNIQLCVGDCYNKNHILESLKLLILALTNNENTEILFNAKFMITYNYIIIKKDIFELSIKNTHSFRTSLICVLNECYEYVTDF
jgi:hypothetical protein